ncbi:acyl carrier protein [Streptomyces diastatochromogenes]|uniref:acyl carrier protein n=1 Tax=Streptomyces diastatochromogenes TaxID=42236 RepID=UPI00117DE92E|nr:acyl carrier protein [Streptomyces diastatochromogenes]MCZ0986186.1 acyl carrier protein [Streptomyces diastatochromogenes]
MDETDAAAEHVCGCVGETGCRREDHTESSEGGQDVSDAHVHYCRPTRRPYGRIPTAADTTGRGNRVGVPGQFKKPSLPAGRLRDLNDALHALHLIAGQPSLEIMHRLLQKRISRTRLHDAFTEPRLPPWDTVDALVEILAARAPGTSPQEVLPEVHALWVLASRQRSLLNPYEREVRDEVVAIFAQQMEVRQREVELVLDVPLVEIAADSLTVLEAVGVIERCFGVVLDEEGVMEAVTIGEMVTLTLSALKATQE